MANQNKKFTKKEFKETKGKRNFKGSKGEEKDLEIKGRSASSMNDPAWYALNPQLLADTASLPYAWATGLKWLMNTKYGDIGNHTTPGLMAGLIDLDPLTSNDAIDPVNVASREIVGSIRAYNSGAKNYDAPDLMIRILAEGCFISQLNWAMRVYATVNMYSSVNKYLPRDLLMIQGVDPDDLREHLADYRAALNNVIAKAAAVIYVPKGLPLFERWSWLFRNYYMDSNSVKDQLYLLSPESYYTFDIDVETSMGKLTYHKWSERATGEYLTWDEIIEGLEAMLNPLVEDQDLCIMTGDMIKAYGPSSWSFTLVPENVIAVPVYDYVVLEQFKNLRTSFMGSVGEGLGHDTLLNIEQDENGEYLHHPTYTRATDSYVQFTGDPSGEAYSDETKDGGLGKAIVDLLHSDHILDTLSNSPNPVVNMENSRLITMVTDVEVVDEGATTAFKVTSGSEKVVSFKIGYRKFHPAYQNYTFEVATLHTVNLIIEPNLALTNDTSIVPDSIEIGELTMQRADARDIRSMLVNFDFAPNTYWAELIGITLDNTRAVLFQDPGDFSIPQMRMSNIAFLGHAMAEKMNNCALLSEMNITGITAKTSRRNKDSGK